MTCGLSVWLSTWCCAAILRSTQSTTVAPSRRTWGRRSWQAASTSLKMSGARSLRWPRTSYASESVSFPSALVWPSHLTQSKPSMPLDCNSCKLYLAQLTVKYLFFFQYSKTALFLQLYIICYCAYYTAHISFPPTSSLSFLPSLCTFLYSSFSPSNNLCLLPSLSVPCRLLKVKPEERLTIEGVLAHPWLNCTEALDNVLPSAQMMMDKVSPKLKVHNLAAAPD